MSENGKDLIFSESVKAGKRVYYFDVKQSRNGDNYITITESKKSNEGTPENPRVVFEKHKLFLYKEDYSKFVDALAKVITVAQGGEIPAGSAEEPKAGEAAKVASVVEEKKEAVAQEEPKAEKKSFLDKMKGIF